MTVNEKARVEIGKIDLRMAQRTGFAALILWLAAVGGLLGVSSRGAAGLLLGGGITLGFLALHLALAKIWLRPGPRRWVRPYLWGIWLVKWPLVSVVLWFGIKSGWANPIALCAGAGIIPMVATVMALRPRPTHSKELA